MHELKSNITAEEAEKILKRHELESKKRQLEAERTAKCPVCGARRERERTMSRFESDIVEYLRQQRVFKRDSCILCVQKHVGRAMEYYKEMLTAQGSGAADGTAAVNVKLNHLAVLGQLGCAFEEADDFSDLQTALLEQERKYRYEGIEPDWQYLAALIVEYEQVIEAAGALKQR